MLQAIKNYFTALPNALWSVIKMSTLAIIGIVITTIVAIVYPQSVEDVLGIVKGLNDNE